MSRVRLRIACFTSPIALVMRISRGRASVQLKIVRQRHTPSRSSGCPAARPPRRRTCRRSSGARSRVGPEAGQLVVHAAHPDALRGIVKALAALHGHGEVADEKGERGRGAWRRAAQPNRLLGSNDVPGLPLRTLALAVAEIIE